MLVQLNLYSTKYYWRWDYNTVDGNDLEKPEKSPEKAHEKPWKIVVNF